MSTPQHDPELFDELMRAQRRRKPVGRYAVATLIFGLVAITGVLVFRAATGTSPGDRLRPGEAHGLEVTAGQCFWSPTGTGEVDVLLRSCTESHTAEAFAVLPLPEGSPAGVGESYQQTLDRCTASARPIPGARVQVITPFLESSAHRAVCYYRFATEMTAPAH